MKILLFRLNVINIGHLKGLVDTGILLCVSIELIRRLIILYVHLKLKRFVTFLGMILLDQIIIVIN